MTLDRIRTICLGFPHATEQIQWVDDLVFKIGGKMFAVANMTEVHTIAFKCTPAEFATLIEMDGVRPAPYLARAHWVLLEDFDTLKAPELTRRLRDSYDLVFAGLTKKVRQSLLA